jgi:hypothetical protein
MIAKFPPTHLTVFFSLFSSNDVRRCGDVVFVRHRLAYGVCFGIGDRVIG